MSSRSHDKSRREFVAAGAAALAWAGTSAWPTAESAPSAHAAAGLTAQQVVDRIRANAGVPWRETTVDTFKAGDPQTIVTGIATTVMATLPVLRQAAAAGRNLIVTCEPTFYNGNDDPGPRGGRSDPPGEEGVHRRAPAGHLALSGSLGRAGAERIRDGAGRRARLDEIPDGENPLIYAIPPTTVSGLAAHVRARLGVRGPGRRASAKAAACASSGTRNADQARLPQSRDDDASGDDRESPEGRPRAER
jgi:hypothetical protein